jgi:uncharacterized protein YggE
MLRFVRTALVAAFTAVGMTATGSSIVTAQVSSSVPQAVQPPAIVVTAVGEARTTPDRATIHIAVGSEGASAAAAAADNATKQTRVIDAVKAAGVAPAQIRTAGYNVSPEYSGGRTPKVTGYRAHNTVQVEVRNVADVGKVIDAALGAGATNIGSVGLYASRTDSARREAIQQAVAKARGEAETSAAAAGGTLGTLLELTIDPAGLPRPMMHQVMVTSAAVGNMAMPTPIETGESVVLAVVRARWQFVPGQR